jgi:DNA (cytosine-5)-methyltransferase 1
MRQSTIFDCLAPSHDDRSTLPADTTPPEVFDLFCGAGGFSAGAAQAGCRIAFACDSDAEALETHRRNHAGAVHRLMNLPSDDIPFPTDGRSFHVHGSPPCQQFSPANTLGRTAEKTANSTHLIEWYLETALSSNATSWSMEQVATGGVLQIVERIRAQNPNAMAYGVFRFEELGVPQTRKRLIAGSPNLVAKLLRLRSKHNKRSAADVLQVGRATHIRNAKAWTWTAKRFDGERVYSIFTGRAPENSCTISVSLPAPTVLTSCYLRWVWWVDGEPVYQQLSISDCKTLQTFPDDYHFPQKSNAAKRLIGNALPPLVAKLLMG